MSTGPAYRLETLLGLRKRAREEAERALAERKQAEQKAQRQVELQAEELRRRRAVYDEHKRAMYEGSGVTIDLLQQRQRYLDRLQAEVDEQSKELERVTALHKTAQDELREAQDELTRARQDEEALIKHKAKWLAQQKVVTDRRAEDAADEIAQTTWRKKR